MRKSRGCVAQAVLVALTIGSPMLGLSAQTGTPLSQAAIAEGVRAARHDAAERAALAAMDAYLETWNTRSLDIWATSLHFPHVRPGPGRFRMTRSPGEYRDTVDFAQTLATGWHRSQWDSRRVLHVGEDKVHIAGQYTRYTINGEKIWSAIITYIVTRQGEHWGTQARFAAGRAALGSAEKAEHSAGAETAIRDYFDTLNTFDPDRWAETMHYPQVRVAGGTARLWETAEALKAGREPGRMRAWHRTRVESIEPVQVGENGVNAIVRYHLQNPLGHALSTVDAVFLVTRRNGVWKVQARSSYAP